MFSRDDVRAHIQAKFEAAEILRIPSPHIEISGFFPDDVYAGILKYNPFLTNAGSEWLARDKAHTRRQDTPYHQRKQVDLKGEFDGPEEAKIFWAELRDVFLVDNWFGKMVQDKYPAFFDLRFGEAAQDPDFFDRLRNMIFVQRHERGYSIGPHTDSPNRVFTSIFSFPDQEGYDEYGTEFVRPKDPDQRCHGDLHHDPKDFEVVRLAPYKPNNFVLFFKTNASFHSVREMDKDIPLERYGMQLGFYEPRGGLFEDLSGRGIMDDRTSKPLLDVKVFGKTLQLHR